jgi:hypothetical protein
MVFVWNGAGYGLISIQLTYWYSGAMERSQDNDEEGGETPKFNLRLPKGLRERIEDAKRKSGRSLNGELVARIQTSLDTEQPVLIVAIQKLNSMVEQLKTAVDKVNKRLDKL